MTDPRVQRVSADDRVMLQASARWPQINAALALVDSSTLLDKDGSVRIEQVRRAIAAKLDLVPRLRQIVYQPGRWRGGPLWIDAARFRIEDHVRVCQLPAGATEQQLITTCERLARAEFDPSRPLWEMWLLPGLPERRIGLLVRMHHAIADGTAAMTDVAALLETDAHAPPREPALWTPRPIPSARALLIDVVRRRVAQVSRVLWASARFWISVRRMMTAASGARELLAGEKGPKTSLGRLIGQQRNLALVRSDIGVLKQVAHAYDATVNDVLLAVVAGGLTQLLRTRGEFPRRLPVYVPVALRRGVPGVQQGNRLAQITEWLPLDVRDPVARLRQIAAESARLKKRRRPELGRLFALIPSRLLLKFAAAQRVNVTTANIHGPELPLYLAGAEVLEVFPIPPLLGTVALGIGGVSYAGTFGIGLAGDRATYPDLEVLATALRDELDLLAASVRGTAVSSRGREEVPAGRP